MDAVNPIDVRPLAVPTIHHDPEPVPGEPPGPPPASPPQQRLAKHVPPERPGNPVDNHVRVGGQIIPGPVGDEVDRAAAGQVSGQGQVRPIHAAERGEVSGHQQPSGHLRTPAGAPGLESGGFPR